MLVPGPWIGILIEKLPQLLHAAAPGVDVSRAAPSGGSRAARRIRKRGGGKIFDSCSFVILAVRRLPGARRSNFLLDAKRLFGGFLTTEIKNLTSYYVGI